VRSDASAALIAGERSKLLEGQWSCVGDAAGEKTYSLPRKADSYQEDSKADVVAGLLDKLGECIDSDNSDSDLGSLVRME